MIKTNKIVLFGDSAFAEIAYEYFTYDSAYEVVGFTVSEAFLTKNTLFNLPVVAFEEVDKIFPPPQYKMHIALIYNQQNRIRKQFYEAAKAKNYQLVNYISSKAFVWRNVELGDNCFIFEDNTIQPFVKIGNNNVLWSGNHIGHHSSIGSHNFFSSHVVISGFCTIGNANFFGVNSTVINNLKIEDDCTIGSSSHIVRNLESGTLIKGAADNKDSITTWQKFNLDKL